jgi:hypothetical protein
MRFPRKLFAAALLTAFLVLAAATLGTPATAHAQGFVGIFSDTRGCPCEVTDRGGIAILTVTVLHVDALSGARGSRFSAVRPGCFAASFLSETSPFQTIGNSQVGIAIDYGRCLTGTFRLLTITYLAYGTTPDCCIYAVHPDPTAPSGRIEAVDCNDQIAFLPEWVEIINSNVTCQCTAGPDYCYPVPTETSTWGRVKSLYATD